MAKNANLLPEDTAPDSIDMSNLRVNFSDEEASSEAFSFEPMPSGKYHVAITEWEMRTSKSEKHNGKPYWALTLTVQNGPYENRKLWTNCMLFEGALYTLSQLLKATGHEDAIKTGEIPDEDTFISAPVTLNVRKMRDTYREEQNGDGEVLWKNEVKGILKPAEDVSKAKGKSGKGSLLP